MPTRLNFTDRKRLGLDQIDIRIHPAEDQPATFDVSLNLESLKPQHTDARVFVEAYRQSIRMRFDFGTVGNFTAPPVEQRRLTEFEDWQRVLFRIKVTKVDGEDLGRLVAWRNQIAPVGPDDASEHDLLPFKSDNLDGRVWDLDFDEGGPVVLIDREAGDPHGVGGDPKFQAAVFPEALRRVLTQAFIVEIQNGGDETHWSHKWLEDFIKPKLKQPDPPPLDDGVPARLTWIDEVASAFASHHKLSQQWDPDAGEAE